MVRTADSCFVTFFSPAFTGREGTDQKKTGPNFPQNAGKVQEPVTELGPRHRCII